MEDLNSTKPCSNYWCKRSLPFSSTAKTCELCREYNREAQQVHCIKNKERASTGVDHATLGSKRKQDPGQNSDHTSCCQKKKQEVVSNETEDEEEFDIGGLDFTEPNEDVSNKC